MAGKKAPKKTCLKFLKYSIRNTFIIFIITSALAFAFFAGMQLAMYKQQSNGAQRHRGKFRSGADTKVATQAPRYIRAHAEKHNTSDIRPHSAPADEAPPSTADECALPVVIGGFTGSGTRLPLRLLQAVGFDMGHETMVSKDGDSLLFAKSVRKANPKDPKNGIHSLIKTLMRQTHSPEYEVADVDGDIAERVSNVFSYFKTNIRNRLHPGCSTLWGWKGPRQMWFLPFIEKIFGRYRFVYVIRDVRDLLVPDTSFAFHDKYWIVDLIGRSGFSKVNKAEMWAKASLAVKRWCTDRDCIVFKAEDIVNGKGLREFLSSVTKSNDTISDEKYETLNMEVVHGCLGASTHGCNEGEAFSSPYGKWRHREFFEGPSKAMRCTEYKSIMRGKDVAKALRAFGFHIGPSPC